MKLKLFGSIIAAAAFILGAWLSPAQASDPNSLPGATLFKTKTCVACHGFGKKLAGPDLKGLFTRRDEAWVRKWLKDPVGMAKTDPIGQKLLAEWKTQMPPMPLTDAEMNQMIEYLKAASK